MEENNQNKAVEQTPIAETPSQTVNQSEPSQAAYVPRKNNRNRSFNQQKRENNNEAASCGEIENTESFTEKLSGKHIAGYQGVAQENNEENKTGESHNQNERFERRNRFERDDRRGENRGENRGERRFERRERSDVKPENTENKTEESHLGPSFENSQVRNRTIEFSLDKRPNGARKPEEKSPALEAPKTGIFSKIKKLLKSIFSSKKNSSNVKFKSDGKRDWKNNKGGQKNRNGEWKGKRHHNNNRHHHNNQNHGGRRDGRPQGQRNYNNQNRQNSGE